MKNRSVKKRIGTLALALCLLLSSLPWTPLEQVHAASDLAVQTTENLLDARITVTNWQASVEVKTKAGFSGNTVMGVILRASDYAQNPSFAGSPTYLDTSRYDGLGVAAAGQTPVLVGTAADSYRHGSVLIATSESTYTALPLRDKNKAARQNLQSFTLNQTTNEGHQEFYQTYVLILFDSSAGSGAAEKYYITTFHVDSQGNKPADHDRTQGYMLRYLPNKPAEAKTAVQGTMTPEIKDKNAGATLKKNAFSLVGYTFKGWNTLANGTGTDYADESSVAPGGYAGALAISAYYAQWKARPVEYASSEAEQEMPEGQVGRAYPGYVFELGGDTDPDSTKSFVCTKVEQKVDGVWTDLTGSGDYPGNLPKGMRIAAGAAGAVDASGHKSGTLTGTPEIFSDTPLRFTIQVKDEANTTTDEGTFVIPRIKKGEQEKPELDWNTALQGRVLSGKGTSGAAGSTETAGSSGSAGAPVGAGSPGSTASTGGGDGRVGAEIGQIIGFYSPNAGAPDYAGKFYQYMPADLDPTDEANWRDVSTENDSGSAAVWPDTYGDVQPAAANDWVKGELPAEGKAPLEVTNLPVGKDYFIRFKALETFVASDYVTVNTSGSVSGGGTVTDSGLRLIYNLMGATSGAGITGSALEGQSLDETALREAFAPLSGLKAGAVVTIPAIELQRSGYAFKGWHPSNEAGLSTYQPGASFTMPEGNVAFGAVMQKESAAADPDDFASLAFYDWDETLLGTVVISKEAAKTDIATALDAFHQIKYSSYSAIDLSSTADTWADKEAYPLTYKKGYNFKGWVQVDGGEGTESLTDAFTAYETAEKFEADTWNYDTTPTEGWGNIVLKAGYVESESCNQGTGTSYYTISDYSFNRYGASNNDTAGNYSIKFIVRRENLSGNGVSRTKEIGLRVLLTTETGSTSIYTLNVPKNQDTFQSETVVPKSMKSVSVTVIEQDGAENFTTAKGRSVTNNAVINKNTSSVITSKGYVYEGTIVFINQQGIAYNQGLTNTWNQVNARAFIDAQLTNEDGSDFTTAQVNAGKKYLLEALKKNENQPLTQPQMLHAVRNEGELIAP